MQASDAPLHKPRREPDRMAVIGASLSSPAWRERMEEARAARAQAMSERGSAAGAETRAREAGQFAALAQMPPPAARRPHWLSPLLLLPMAALLGAFLGVITLAWPEGGQGLAARSSETPATFRVPASSSTDAVADTGFEPAPYGVGAGKRVEALPPPGNAKSTGAELAAGPAAQVAARAPSAKIAPAPPAKIAADAPANAAASVVAYGEVKARALETDAAPMPAISVAAPQSLSRTQVLDIQRRLNRLGFGAGKVDGVYGPQASGAMAEWRSANGVARVGLPSAEEIQMLRAQAAARVVPPRRPKPEIRLAAANASKCRRNSQGRILTGQGFSCDAKALGEALGISR